MNWTLVGLVVECPHDTQQSWQAREPSTREGVGDGGVAQAGGTGDLPSGRIALKLPQPDQLSSDSQVVSLTAAQRMAGHYAGPMAGEAFGLSGGGEHYDRMILMTYPVDLRAVPEEHKVAYRDLAARGLNMVYYPGSSKGRCEDCGVEVYIAPNQQQRLREQPDMQVLCAYCAGKALAQAEATEGASYDIQPAGKESNPNGIPRVFVNTGPNAKGYRISCAGCGRKAYVSEPPGRKVALCPDCVRKSPWG